MKNTFTNLLYLPLELFKFAGQIMSGKQTLFAGTIEQAS